MIFIRRVYNPALPNEKYRILVDRLWPRGIAKVKATWDEWMKDIAPSNEIRKWYHQDTSQWQEFKSRYIKELTINKEMVRQLKSLENKFGSITLLYASKNVEKNNAIVLKSYLDKSSH